MNRRGFLKNLKGMAALVAVMNLPIHTPAVLSEAIAEEEVLTLESLKMLRGQLLRNATPVQILYAHPGLVKDLDLLPKHSIAWKRPDSLTTI